MNSPKCPIAIPTYKNRPDNIVRNLDNVSDNEIYVFCYKDDYENYKQYDCKKNVTFVKLDVPWRSIQKKRVFIQNYFIQRPEIERYIMIDDDMIGCRIQDTDGKAKNITLKEGLCLLEKNHIKYCKTMSGGCYSSITMAHTDIDVNYNKRFLQVFCFENSWVIEHPECRFKDYQNMAEDLIIFFDALKNKQQFCRFDKIRFTPIERKSHESLASSEDNLIKNFTNGLRYMKEYSKPEISKYFTARRNKLSWCIDYQKDLKINEKYEQKIKPILEKYMPGFEDLNNDYDIETFIFVFDEITNVLAKDFKYSKRKSDIAVFKPLMDEFNKVNSLTDFYE